MGDPNDTYKRAVQELQTRLGRPPTTRDAEFVRLGEELRQALAGVADGRSPERPTAIDSSPETGPVALSEPEGISARSRLAEGAMVGSRGAHGGVVARCQTCDRLWERPRRRGRPAVVCPECR